MRPKPKFTEALNCRVSPALKEALDAESERRGVSSNELVRLAVEAFLAPAPPPPPPPPPPPQPELPPELLPRPVLAPSSTVAEARTVKVKPKAAKATAKPTTRPKAKAKTRW